MMRISSKADYAVRAMIELAGHDNGGPVSSTEISTAHEIALPFLEHILDELLEADLVRSDPAQPGRFSLARGADEVTIADVILAVEGSLATVRGVLPEDLAYSGAADALPRVWVALRQTLLTVVEQVTIGALADHRLPVAVDRLTAQPEASVAP
jgi:Rrf2 family protein